MTLVKGRQAFARRAWTEAYEHLTAADAGRSLSAPDLEHLAQAAYLSGRDDEAAAAFARAHRLLRDRGEPERAARWGFWLSFNARLAGDIAQSTGWFTRVRRLAALKPDGVAPGYACLLTGLRLMGQGDVDGARTNFERTVALADRFEDSDLLAFGLLGRGQALVQGGRVADGVPQLDEAMITVASLGVSAMATGVVYCAVIVTCHRIFDLQRCKEWTRILSDWCASQPDLVAFRGQCLLLRSEIMQLEGRWVDAMAEVDRAIEVSVRRDASSGGRAFYRRAELHRLRGAFARAEEAYEEAARRGTEPQPGLSLLRLAQGHVDQASAAIRRLATEAMRRQGPGKGPDRLEVLRASVEIMIAAGDLDAAGAAAGELGELAAETQSPYLRASSLWAAGAIQLARGDAGAALPVLRDAWQIWQRMEAPYESGETRVLIGRACRMLGDVDTARSHHDSAARTFEGLGAAPALAGLDAPEARPEATSSSPLTDRELAVLNLVAAGGKNREIAEELSISEHTVARHLSNIFDKLGVTSRTAAATFAIERGFI